MKPIWRILLIEDNLEDAFFIERAIHESNGMQVEITIADTKESMIQAIEEKYFDFIITDIKLPYVTFDEILKILEYYQLGLPVIIVSGSTNPEDIPAILGLKTNYIYVNKRALWQIGPILKHAIETENAQFEMVQVLIGAMDYKDQGTGDHSDRVVNMTVQMARRMKISERRIREIRFGALLHDIGKMGIPDKILLKPTTLNDEEWEIMRMHPKKGYDLLCKSVTLKKYAEIAYCHHEKWDGRGYPQGLHGTQIPLSARIFAVVDVYDALTNDRPYRKAWTKEQAIIYLQSEKGAAFDPEVVDLFIEMIQEEPHA